MSHGRYQRMNRLDLKKERNSIFSLTAFSITTTATPIIIIINGLPAVLNEPLCIVYARMVAHGADDGTMNTYKRFIFYAHIHFIPVLISELITRPYYLDEYIRFTNETYAYHYLLISQSFWITERLKRWMTLKFCLINPNFVKYLEWMNEKAHKIWIICG